MSPLNITQPLGIWSIMATIRWCPIFPKWDIYQPLSIPCAAFVFQTTALNKWNVVYISYIKQITVGIEWEWMLYNLSKYRTKALNSVNLPLRAYNSFLFHRSTLRTTKPCRVYQQGRGQFTLKHSLFVPQRCREYDRIILRFHLIILINHDKPMVTD